MHSCRFHTLLNDHSLIIMATIETEDTKHWKVKWSINECHFQRRLWEIKDSNKVSAPKQLTGNNHHTPSSISDSDDSSKSSEYSELVSCSSIWPWALLSATQALTEFKMKQSALCTLYCLSWELSPPVQKSLFCKQIRIVIVDNQLPHLPSCSL